MHRRIRNSSFLLLAVLAVSMLLAGCTGAVPAQVAQLAEVTPAATAAATTAPTEEPARAEATAAPTEEPAPAEATAQPAEEAAPAPEAPAEESAGSALEGVTWQVVDYLAADGTVATPVAPATVTFQNGQVTGNGGCNGFIASYTIDGAVLTVTLGGMTDMACEDALMAQEQAILAALDQTASYAVADAQVTLLDSEGAVLLTLSAQTSSGLTGVVWRATNYNNGREAVVGMLEDTEITAIFDEEGALSGSAGCNNYVAGYTTDGNQITIGPAASTMMFCEEPEGVMEQEAAYLAALATAATYSINGQVLEMRTADDAMAVRFEVATDSVVAPEAPASADPDPVAADAEAAPVAFAAAAAAANAATPTGRVTAPLGVNIRVGPGTQFPIVGVAPLDTTGEIIGRSADGQWWAARVPSAPNEQGWAAAAYVEASNAATTCPCCPRRRCPKP